MADTEEKKDVGQDRESLEEEIRRLRNKLRELETNVQRTEPARSSGRSEDPDDRDRSTSRGRQSDERSRRTTSDRDSRRSRTERQQGEDEPSEERRSESMINRAMDESSRLVRGTTLAYVDALRQVMNEWYSFADEVLRPPERRRSSSRQDDDRDDEEDDRPRNRRRERDESDEPVSSSIGRSVNRSLDLPRRAIDRFTEGYYDEERQQPDRRD